MEQLETVSERKPRFSSPSSVAKGGVKESIFDAGVEVGVRSGSFELIAVERREIEPMIIAGHYSHTMPKQADLCMKIMYDGVHSGALSMGYGIRPKMKHTWGLYDSDDVREFDRLYLTDVPPFNSETLVIGMLTYFLRRTRPELKYLLSYSDGTVGNKGTIYKAANFIELEPRGADFYRLASGERIHPVSMWHRHGTRKIKFLEVQYPGIQLIRGKYAIALGIDPYQYRYILPLTKEIRAAYLLRNRDKLRKGTLYGTV